MKRLKSSRCEIWRNLDWIKLLLVGGIKKKISFYGFCTISSSLWFDWLVIAVYGKMRYWIEVLWRIWNCFYCKFIFWRQNLQLKLRFERMGGWLNSDIGFKINYFWIFTNLLNQIWTSKKLQSRENRAHAQQTPSCLSIKEFFIKFPQKKLIKL